MSGRRGYGANAGLAVEHRTTGPPDHTTGPPHGAQRTEKPRMRSLTVGQSLGLMLLSSMCSSTCTSCVYYTTVISPVFIHFHRGQFQVNASPQPIAAAPGDDVILPCRLEPPSDASDITVEWSRNNLKPRFVHLRRDGRELINEKNPSYTGRTSLFEEELKNADLSLLLSRVKFSDEGRYRCFVPSLAVESFVELVVREPQPTLALAGDDITLWYEPKPQTDFTDVTVEWSRADLKPRFVHLYRDRLELYESKNPAYNGRTTLAAEGLKQGNISLKLSRVRLSDQGNYTCFIPKLSKEANIQLIVGAVSQPVTSLLGMNQDRQGVVLGCRSEGWYPEPELSWLDSEGNVFPPGSTETVRGPDGTWNVNSMVTVEKTNTNRFTCRVHLQMFSRTREAEIHVPEVFFPEKQSSYALGIFVTAAVAVAIGLLLLVSYFIFFRRSVVQRLMVRNPKRERQNTQDILLTQEGKMEDHTPTSS